MKQTIYFCKSWFRAKKRPTEAWTRQEAESAHASNKLYTVLVGSAEKPTCFLEVNDKFVGVGFLDDRLREKLYYAFKEVEPGKLFLSMATYREFKDDSDVVASGTTYIFERDGTVKIQQQRFSPHSTTSSETTADVSANYSAWPSFGEYDDLIKAERVGRN